jgi:hypothetical protein
MFEDVTDEAQLLHDHLSYAFEVYLVADSSNSQFLNANGTNKRQLKLYNTQLIPNPLTTCMQTVIMEAAYSGSYSGQYTFEVIGLYCESVNPCVEGRRTYDTTDSSTSAEFALEVKVEVSDFWPKEGSPYGGTLLTIYGWNFVDDADR